MTIYQLYYNDKSKQNCFNQSIKVKCPDLTEKDIWVTKKFPLFENHKILEIGEDFKGEEMHGILSHAFFNKSRKDYSKLLALSNTGNDVVTFNRIAKGRNALIHLDQYHGIGTQQLMIDLLEESRLPINPIRECVYSNHFLAKGYIYSEYVNTWLMPFCHEILKPKWDKRTYVPANYRKAIREKGCDYPLHTFLIERLFSLYLASNNFKIIEQ